MFVVVVVLEKISSLVETCLNIDRSHQDSGSIWDPSSIAATNYVWDHGRMCVLMSRNSGYLIWDCSCRTNTNIFLLRNNGHVLHVKYCLSFIFLVYFE